MMESAQFLHILAAESEHLVTVSISLPPYVKSDFERHLNDAFASDSFSDAARAWNEERSLVIQEVFDYHLIPAGIKWTREYIREEVEDYLAAQCASDLRNVRKSYAISLNMAESFVACRCRTLYHQCNETRRHRFCPRYFVG